jgi:hypothetical protein
MRNLSAFIILIMISCSKPDDKGRSYITFDTNATVEDIYPDIENIISKSELSIIFFRRGDTDSGWYKIFSKQGENWEKIEIQQWIFNEEQLRSEPEYYIARDITTRKLCKPEEAKSFLKKLISYRLFELPEEDKLFKDCENTRIADLGSIYIQIVAGERVRNLKYSGMYKCAGNEWESIRNIDHLFKDEWIDDSMVGVGMYNK